MCLVLFCLEMSFCVLCLSFYNQLKHSREVSCRLHCRYCNNPEKVDHYNNIKIKYAAVATPGKYNLIYFINLFIEEGRHQ